MWCSELPTTWGDRMLTGALRVNMNMLKRTQSTLQARVERLACVPWEGHRARGMWPAESRSLW